MNKLFLLITIQILSSLAINASNCIWLGTTDDKWSTPSNWSCGMVPGSGDTVLIDEGIVQLDVNAEVMQIPIALTGSLQGSNNLSVTGDFNWSGSGDIGDGSGGTITVAGKCTFDGNTSKTLNGKQIILNGEGEYLAGDLTMSNSAKIEITNNHTLDFASTSNYNIGTFDNSSIINNGPLKKSGPASVITEIKVQLDNNDTILYESGYLRVTNMDSENGVILITGTFFIRGSTISNTEISGGIMRIEGLTTIQPGTTIDSRIDIISGTLVNNTSLTLNKPFNLSFSGGSVVGNYLGGAGSELILNNKSSWKGLSNMDGNFRGNSQGF